MTSVRYVFIHPVVGLLAFDRYTPASRTAEDIGIMYDTQVLDDGYEVLKARGFLVHTEAVFKFADPTDAI